MAVASGASSDASGCQDSCCARHVRRNGNTLDDDHFGGRRLRVDGGGLDGLTLIALAGSLALTALAASAQAAGELPNWCAPRSATRAAAPFLDLVWAVGDPAAFGAVPYRSVLAPSPEITFSSSTSDFISSCTIIDLKPVSCICVEPVRNYLSESAPRETAG